MPFFLLDRGVHAQLITKLNLMNIDDVKPMREIQVLEREINELLIHADCKVEIKVLKQDSKKGFKYIFTVALIDIKRKVVYQASTFYPIREAMNESHNPDGIAISRLLRDFRQTCIINVILYTAEKEALLEALVKPTPSIITRVIKGIKSIFTPISRL